MTAVLRRLAPWFAIVWGAAAVGHAQWLNYPAAGAPRLPNGKVNLAAKPPRTRDGTPDLSGVWQTQLEAPDGKQNAFVVPGDDPRTFSKYFLNILADFKPDDLPMRPSAVEMLRTNAEGRTRPAARCLPLGLPSMDVFSYSPFKMIQTPGVLIVLYEMDNAHRQIYTDGRTLPVDPQPTWGGYSVGRWEGDTLVVEAAGFRRSHPARRERPSTQRTHAFAGALPPTRLRTHGPDGHGRRPGAVYEAVVVYGHRSPAAGQRRDSRRCATRTKRNLRASPLSR